jgi:hypothetical protein
MNPVRSAALALLAMAVAPPVAASSCPGGFNLAVLVDGSARPEYAARGNLYVEALRGREYALRITNPLGVRVAVALSVDGLNTIDARHAPNWESRKWVLGPYETTVISGWQVSGETARRFFFTGERSSYGAKLGETENLGTIEAVFFREKTRPQPVWRERQSMNAPGAARDEAAEGRAGAAAPMKDQAAALSDDYAATGMGGRTRHDVYEVALELDPRPVATLRVRYEFHDALVKLGVFPDGSDPLRRRESARGFDSWCPVR